MPIRTENIPRLSPYLAGENYGICDNMIGAIYQWRDAYKSAFAIAGNMLVMRAVYEGIGLSYTYPLGNGCLDEALRCCEADAAANGQPLRFCVVPKAGAEVLLRRYGERCTAEPRREWADYLYECQAFLEYAGNKLHTQRNHVNRFVREHPNAVLSPIDDALFPACTAFLERLGQRDELSRIERNEIRGAMELMALRDALGQKAAALTEDGRILALSVGERSGDVLYVHVEKADAAVPGAFPAMAQAFVRYAGEGLTYVNREDDAGDEGIRESKERYRPCRMIEKFYVTVR